jgi:FdhE protein
MAVVLVGPDVWAERRRRVAELRARQGFARQLLDFYGALLGAQEKAHHDAVTASPAAVDLVPFTVEVVVPGVIDVSVSTGPERMRSQLIERLERTHPREMLQRWIDGEDQSLIEGFLARASLGPVLEALGRSATAACRGPRDSFHCPQCGGLPQLSYFAPGPEDLATGPRRLLCSRCGAFWGYPRMTCAACGEQDSAKLTILSEHGTTSGERGNMVRGLSLGPPRPALDAVFPHMRIDACDTCRAYLLSVDLAAEPRAVAVVDELAAIPLDLFARDRGFTKIIPNLMGF